MHNPPHPRFRTFNPLSAIRIALLALALVAANTPLQSARASDVTVPFDPQWNFNAHTEYPGSDGSLTVSPDGKSVKLAFDFTKGGSFVSAGRILESTSTFSGVEVKAKGSGGLGISIVDSTDQTFVYQLGVPGDAEKTFQVNFLGPNLVFGGAKDKIVHYPLKSLSITVSKSPDHLSGAVEVTGIVLKGSPQ